MEEEIGLDGKPFKKVVVGSIHHPIVAAPATKPMVVKSIEKKEDQKVSLYAMETVDLFLSFFDGMVKQGASVGWDKDGDKPFDKFIDVEGDRFRHDFLSTRKLSLDDKREVVRLFKEKAKAEGRKEEEVKKLLLSRIFPSFII